LCYVFRAGRIDAFPYGRTSQFTVLKFVMDH
jgi:hypothetical protein